MSGVQDQESTVDPVAASVDLAAATVSPKVGAQLCAERKRLGLSVADIAQRLKYAPRQVEALESDRLEALPGLTFTRGFIRGYAKLLGMNSDPLVAMLEKSIERDAGPTTLQLQSVSAARAQFPERGRAKTWPWVLAIVLVIVLLGGYSIYNWQMPVAVLPQTGTSVTPSATPQSVTRAAPTTPGPGATVAPAPMQAAPVVESPSIPADLPATADGATYRGKIRMVFGAESWTEIRDFEGRIVFQRRNLPGTEQWADGQSPFDLVIGNARDVRLFYRGVEVDLDPYIKVTVARLQLK